MLLSQAIKNNADTFFILTKGLITIRILENKTRCIDVIDKLVLFTLKLDGVTDYFTYSDMLVEVFTKVRLNPFRDEGRLRFRINENGAGINYYAYDIALACYYGYINGADSFILDMQKYTNIKRSNNLSVDHADNNIQNNTSYNLSLMRLRWNMKKNNLVTRIKEPLYLNTAYCDNKYRVQMLFKVNSETMDRVILKRFVGNKKDNTGGLCSLCFLCSSDNEYVECLKWLTTTKFEWAEPVRDSEHWFNSDNKCWCANIRNSLYSQSVLAMMNESNFQQFKKD